MKTFLQSCSDICVLAMHLSGDFFRLLRGSWLLSRMHRPAITVFGGSWLQEDHVFAKKAAELTAKLTNNQISVITGGGPGIMRVVNCTAEEIKKKINGNTYNIGIGVYGLDTESRNGCSAIFLKTYYFFTRKYLLTRFSSAFAVFPGGYGTVDELFEVAMLIETKRILHVPIVLFGIDYWAPLLDWVKKAEQEGLIRTHDRALFFITDDVDEAFTYITSRIKK